RPLPIFTLFPYTTLFRSLFSYGFYTFQFLSYLQVSTYMALSKIWSAFIIIAIVAASIQLLTNKQHQDIYSTMIVGKAGDTSQTRSEEPRLNSSHVKISYA